MSRKLLIPESDLLDLLQALYELHALYRQATEEDWERIEKLQEDYLMGEARASTFRGLALSRITDYKRSNIRG